MKQLFIFFIVTNIQQKSCRVFIPGKIYNSLTQVLVSASHDCIKKNDSICWILFRYLSVHDNLSSTGRYLLIYDKCIPTWLSSICQQRTVCTYLYASFYLSDMFRYNLFLTVIYVSNSETLKLSFLSSQMIIICCITLSKSNRQSLNRYCCLNAWPNK